MQEPTHSRGASREFESVSASAVSAIPTTRSRTTADTSEEPKRRRRFSSPFRRSRSRQRSVSAVVSSTTSLVSSASLTAVSNDVPEVPKAFQGRPHSYHAPDLGMHPAYRGSTDQLSRTSSSHEQAGAWMQPSPTRSSFVTETEVQDDDVPPVPPIPAGIANERHGRSRSWGNASLMNQSVNRQTASSHKSSRSLGASPIITQFDVYGRPQASSSRANIVEVPPSVPWIGNENDEEKDDSPRTRHSSPITKGIWMGDTSPVLSKIKSSKAGALDKEQTRLPVVLPKDTDGTLAPADLVNLSKPPDGASDTCYQQPDNKAKATSQSSSRPISPALPGGTSHGVRQETLPSTVGSHGGDRQPTIEHGEAPVPHAFLIHYSGDLSPLLHSSKASLQEVSDDEDGLLSPVSKDDSEYQIQQHVESDLRISDADVVTSSEHDVSLKNISPAPSSLRTVTQTSPIARTDYETKTIGAGDVSPTSDQEDVAADNSAAAQALDLQSALKSKAIGAGDVSPVSTRSPLRLASQTQVFQLTDDTRTDSAGSGLDESYTADVPLHQQATSSRTPLSSDNGKLVERPRIERFETAQEDVQGSSELTIAGIRQPTSRYAAVLAAEPVVSYKEYTGSSSSSSDNLLEVINPQASSALTPQRAELADQRADGGSMPTATRQVSASQLRIVHAVEEYAASNSSLASWDQNSNTFDATSEPSSAVQMKDEGELVTPVAQPPRNPHHEQQHADQAEHRNTTPSYAEFNGYLNDQSPAMPVYGPRVEPTPTSHMTAPERSKSLLSIISSAVSSVPISPASSNAGRSTPSTIYRMQRDFSNAKRTNLTDVQIPEEPTSAKDDQTPTARDEDYDLYADHNGVVKDVHDDNGQPLRIAATPQTAPAQLARVATAASSIGTVPDVQDSPGRRYSFERPMSFVSGPHDDDGRPQDQINQHGAGSKAAPGSRPIRRSQQYPRATAGALYSNFEPVQDMHWPPGEATSVPPFRPELPSVQAPVQAKVVRQPTRFVPSTHKDDDGDDDDDDSDATPAHRSGDVDSIQARPSLSTEGPIPNGQPLQDGRIQANHIPDARVAQNVQPQPRSVSAPLQQLTMPPRDTRVVSQPLASPPSGPLSSPRNELEYQQQMIQLQAKYPRFRGSESQALAQQTSLTQQGPQVSEKPSSKPRLAAAIKGIVGRNSANPPAASNPSPPAPSKLAPMPQPDTGKAESFVSAVSSLSREPNTSISGVPTVYHAGPHRPPSLDGRSQYSHVSHGSTQAQPAQSRQDITAHPPHAQYQNAYLQQYPQQQQTQQPQQQSHLALPQPNAHTQGFRASTGTMADVGKKKRFSAITGLFGKSNQNTEREGRFKLSREEKKAQKAQKHSSQPTLQSPPTQQWPPPNTQFIAPPQPNISPNQATHPSRTVHPPDLRSMPPQGAPQLPRQDLSHMHPQPQMQPQQVYPIQQQSQTDEGSAYLRTKQLAEEHRARQAAGQPSRPIYEGPAALGSDSRLSSDHINEPARQLFQKPLPTNGYYHPEKPLPEQGAYISSHEEQQQVLQMRRQQQLEAERRRNVELPRSPGERQTQQHQRQLSNEHGAYVASQVARQQAMQRQHEVGGEQGAYGATTTERQRQQPPEQFPLPGPEAFGRSQIHYDQIQHSASPQRTAVPSHHERQQLPQPQQQQGMTREEHARQAQEELARHRWQQQQIQLRQFHLQQQAQLAQQQAASRSVSGPLSSHASPPASPVAQRHVSSPEPQYETPPIPGAYGHVQGVYVSPFDQPHAYTGPHSQAGRREPARSETDPQMQPISPQVSEQSHMPPNTRQHSDASSVSVVSPIGPTPEPAAMGTATDQRSQRPRMPSISEVHQQTPPPPQERPWHMNFPAGTTEQDIVRARQKQFLQQQFASQQQAQAERHASSPSPRASPDKQSPPFSAPPHPPQEHGGGFREVLPRHSPQAYPVPQSAPLDRRSPQHIPSHPREGLGRRVSQEPHTPINAEEIDRKPPYVQDPQHTAFDDGRNRMSENQIAPPHTRDSLYDDNVPDEAPPSYDGPGVPNDGMEKSNPERPRPPNIITAPTETDHQQDGRPRQVSLGLMQHPQPASMAASPQRTAPDMGAESLRRQMLQQEEQARMERIQRSQMQALQRQREQQEREVARARAQELERSVSGGGRVGSLRSVSGSRNGGTSGWERRGVQGGNNRPIFELPALEDDEPVMRATSFPGQEWVPPMYIDE